MADQKIVPPQLMEVLERLASKFCLNIVQMLGMEERGNFENELPALQHETEDLRVEFATQKMIAHGIIQHELEKINTVRQHIREFGTGVEEQNRHAIAQFFARREDQLRDQTRYRTTFYEKILDGHPDKLAVRVAELKELEDVDLQALREQQQYALRDYAATGKLSQFLDTDTGTHTTILTDAEDWVDNRSAGCNNDMRQISMWSCAVQEDDEDGDEGGDGDEDEETCQCNLAVDGA